MKAALFESGFISHEDRLDLSIPRYRDILIRTCLFQISYLLFFDLSRMIAHVFDISLGLIHLQDTLSVIVMPSSSRLLYLQEHPELEDACRIVLTDCKSIRISRCRSFSIGRSKVNILRLLENITCFLMIFPSPSRLLPVRLVFQYTVLVSWKSRAYRTISIRSDYLAFTQDQLYISSVSFL